jgi:small subunit ribosomal protein S6
LRNYELALVLNPAVEKDGVTQILDMIGKVVAKGKGKVTEIDRWGLRKLAYPLSGMEEGYYIIVRFDGMPEVVTELDRSLKLSGQILRFMIVRREEDGKPK